MTPCLSPFGKKTIPITDLFGKEGDVPRLFTGKEHDEETGLLYYEARYYDGDLGRFLSVDPWRGELSDPQSLNSYTYTRNNPVKYVDRDGENFILDIFVTPAYAPDVDGEELDFNNLQERYIEEHPEPENTLELLSDVSDFSWKGLLKVPGKMLLKKIEKEATVIIGEGMTKRVQKAAKKYTAEVFEGRSLEENK